MDCQHLEEQLEQDYKLLKKLEDKLRVEDDPKRQEKLKLDIDELKNKSSARQIELQKITENQNLESQPSTNEEFFSSVKHADQTSKDAPYPSGTEREPLSLTDLAGFCSYAFPLLRWIHQPVPSKYVGWYFDKIQEFFMFEGNRIPQREGKSLRFAVECFFRCAYMLPSESFQDDLGEIHNYSRSKLRVAYEDFLEVFKEFGYKTAPYLDSTGSSLSMVSLLSIFHTLRDGFSYTLKSTNNTDTKPLTLAEKDILTFMIYIIDYLFKENSARKSGKKLDLPEGVVLKLYDILNHAFQHHLGVKLPQREDTGELGDFPLYVDQLRRCWEDQNGENIGGA